MRILSDPKVNKDSGNIEANIQLDDKEVKALREAVNYYLQSHSVDPSSNLIPRLKDIESVIDELHGKLRPE